MATLPDTDVWDFKKDLHGRWNWCRQTLFGEVVLEGRKSFAELAECETDAKRHGYRRAHQSGRPLLELTP